MRHGRAEEWFRFGEALEKCDWDRKGKEDGRKTTKKGGTEVSWSEKAQTR